MKEFTLNSPARIHLGFLQLDPNAVRIFGSLGLTISKFQTIIKVNDSRKFIICGSHEKEIMNVIEKFKKLFTLKTCRLSVLDSIPSHTGLGSGTQLSLNVGTILTKFSNLNLSIEDIAKILNRGKRSGVGIGSFKRGGFIVDGGKLRKSKNIPAIIFNSKWPKNWKVILLFESKITGIHGEKEIKEFKKITKVSKNLSKDNCQAVLLKIIPSLIEKDFHNFCEGIQRIQENTAEVFFKSQGGKYTSKKIEKVFNFLKKNGYSGYGQSSWGPTGFIFCENSQSQKITFDFIENYIKNNFIKGVEMVMVEGRNKGLIINQGKK